MNAALFAMWLVVGLVLARYLVLQQPRFKGRPRAWLVGVGSALLFGGTGLGLAILYFGLANAAWMPVLGGLGGLTIVISQVVAMLFIFTAVTKEE